MRDLPNSSARSFSGPCLLILDWRFSHNGIIQVSKGAGRISTPRSVSCEVQQPALEAVCRGSTHVLSYVLSPCPVTLASWPLNRSASLFPLFLGKFLLESLSYGDDHDPEPEHVQEAEDRVANYVCIR